MERSSDQLSDLCCPICLIIYSEKENVPLSLTCGHTHCDKCLRNFLLIDQKKCGECRANITARSTKNLPINYTVLRLLESLKDTDQNIDEYDAVEKKIERVVSKLSENERKYKTQLDELKRKLEEIEAEKIDLEDAKQSLKKKCKNLKKQQSLTETLEIIKATISNIDKVEEQTKLIAHKLEREEELSIFKRLYEYHDEYFVLHKKGKSTCFQRNGLLYLRNFCSPFISQHDLRYNIDFKVLLPFIIRTYMVISYNNRSSILEFELFEDAGYERIFQDFCLGLGDGSPIQKTLYDHQRNGREGESIAFGLLNHVLAPGNKHVSYIRKGYVEVLPVGKPTEKAKEFKIYLEDWPCKSSEGCFGKVVRGGSILKSVVRNKFDIKVTESGVVFDFSLKV